MLELLAGASSFTITVPTILYYRYRKTQKAVRARFLQGVTARRDSLWAEEKKELENACKHLDWCEVQAQTGELVAYLCRNSKCAETLYPDEWKPSGCHCDSENEIYKLSCPVKYHSGKAALLAPSPPKPKPVVSYGKTPKAAAVSGYTFEWKSACPCKISGQSVASSLTELLRIRYLTIRELNKIIPWIDGHIQGCHSEGFHANQSTTFSEWSRRSRAFVQGDSPWSENYMHTTWALLSGTPTRVPPPGNEKKYTSGGVVKYDFASYSEQLEEEILVARKKERAKLIEHRKAAKEFESWLFRILDKP